MATFSDIRAIHGLQGVGTLAADNHSGTVTIGTTQTSTRLTNATKIKAFTALIVGTASDLVIDVSDMDSTGSTAWTAGVAQIETATAAGTITLSGNASVVVTAAGMTGTPKTILVAVTSTDTAATWAGKVRTALAADTAVSALFTVGGSTTSIELTRKPTSTYTVNGATVSVYPANDGTLNISLDNGTCTGITTAASSANTTAGVLTAGAYCTFLDGSDFAGEAAAGISSISGIEITNSDDSVDFVDVSQGGFLVNYPLNVGQVFHTHAVPGIGSSGDITISPNGFYTEFTALVSVVITGV